MKAGIYKLKEGSYQVSYKDSKKKRIRRQFTSLRAAKIYASKIPNNDRSIILLVESSRTVTALLEEYIVQMPESPINKRGKEILESFRTYFKNVHCKDLNKVICAHWIDSVRTKFKYSSRTMRIVKYTYSKFFKDLLDKNLIARNYLADVTIRLGTRTKVRVFLSETELIEILDGLKRLSPDTVYPVIYFLIHTGCKCREALNLKWNQLDLDTGTVSFPRTANANARTVNLSSHILEFLREHPKKDVHVFLNGHGKSWTVRGYYRAMVTDRDAISHVRHWDAFTFRHTFAYHFLRSGKTLHQLQVVIGHRHIEETQKAYGDITS